jgi:hypothetical protein
MLERLRAAEKFPQRLRYHGQKLQENHQNSVSQIGQVKEDQPQTP